MEAQIYDPQSAWSAVRSELERSLPAATFDLWIAPAPGGRLPGRDPLSDRARRA